MKTRDGIERVEDPRAVREHFWVTHYSYLLENGYRLRFRYQPDWVPSWLGAGPDCVLDSVEDWHVTFITKVLDAIRIRDGFAVALKRVSLATPELPMLRFLSWHKNAESPLNHTVPLLQVLPVPDDPNVAIVVMPKLRDFDTPYFHCRREVLECLRQIIEGVGFMHRLNICHGNASTLNFMMDATEVCPQGFHFACPQSRDGTGNNLVKNLRCQCQVKYYIVDFATSRYFVGGRHDALRDTRCGIRTAPELWAHTPYNPFSLDVYNIGATFDTVCNDYFEQLDDLRPFLARLMEREPSSRPTLDEAMTELLKFTASRTEDWLDAPIIFFWYSSLTGLRYHN